MSLGGATRCQCFLWPLRLPKLLGCGRSSEETFVEDVVVDVSVGVFVFVFVVAGVAPANQF